MNTEGSLDEGLARNVAGAARAVWVTRAFLGAPYRTSPLGDGALPDERPRFRLDAFDCTTLVETAIAFGNARSTAEARVLLDDVRYDGAASYAHRNHYLEAEWLPANARKGWIEEVTRRVDPAGAREVVLAYTTASWRAALRHGHLLPHLDPSDLPTGHFSFSIVPLERVREVENAIPPGTLVAVVRTARPDRPYRITHLALTVKGPRGEALVRHASTARMRVIDEPLERFLERAEGSHSWRVEGLSLWALRPNLARVRALEAGGR
ncbi:MAG TPA: N-acetylmuramoyl-L-alanine amidase-like domain-containing protein [Anaeromyxobacteraceae bacterium]|nr:N-acetylmuramoyl-L-alanine amidase-like domain-containing protein [Anaeromyxobacteraceae bacterium]